MTTTAEPLSTARATRDGRDETVLVLAPTGRDAELTSRFIAEAGLDASVCPSVSDLCGRVNERAGLIFLTGEVLTADAVACLVEALAAQETWSDIPVVVLTSGGGKTPANADAIEALGAAGNVTLIERPVRVSTLLSTFHSALRARRRQYDVRDHLAREGEAKEALEQSEERLRIALEAARLGAWQLDLHTGRLDCTALCKSNFGLPRDAEFSYDKLLAAIEPEDRARVRAAVEHALHERTVYREEYRVRWPDGSPHWILATGRGNYAADGEPYAMSGVTLDITARKVAEQERERLLASERAARVDAEAASRLKDEFLATVSHELRTPLTAVLGWTHMLRSGRLDERAATHALETVERNALSQQKLIDDLLDVSRIITGKLLLDVKPIAPIFFIRAAVEAVRPAAEAKEIELQTETEEGVGAVVGDAARLQQVIWNLLSNAIKFTPRGGRVGVALKQVDAHVEISVADTGDGIEAEFLPYVFDRFRQADGSTRRQHGGLGLGLAIVRHLVELHGGTVRAESEGEGRGASFVVRLPLAPVYRREQPGAAATEPASAEVEAPPSEYADKLVGLKVLVLDDEADTLDLIAELFGQCGAEVSKARSAEEARRLLEEARPEVIVSDIGMPGEDGFEFIRSVRALPEERGGRTPAVALTAYARAEDRIRVLHSGFQTYVAKPVELAELVSIVASVAGRA